MRRLSTAWLASLLLVGSAAAQDQKPKYEHINATGKIHSLSEEQINVVTEDNQPWQVKLTKRTSIKVGGDTSMDALRAGMPVRFYGFFNQRGQATEPVTAMTVFTPNENFAPLVELSPEEEEAEEVSEEVEGEGEDADAAEEEESGRRARRRPSAREKPNGERYYISGVLTSIRRGKFVVNVGDLGSVKGEIAKDAIVSVDLNTHAAASPGDTISFRGIFYPNAPNEARASSVEITLAPPEEDIRAKRRREKEEAEAKKKEEKEENDAEEKEEEVEEEAGDEPEGEAEEK